MAGAALRYLQSAVQLPVERATGRAQARGGVGSCKIQSKHHIEMGRQGKRQREHSPSSGTGKGHPGGTDHPGSPQEGEQGQGKKCEPGEGNHRAPLERERH